MTDPKKPDHARAWRYVEKLLDEEDEERLQSEEERIEKMSEEELRAELKAEGHEPADDWSAEEMLQRAEIRAGLRTKEEGTVAGAGTRTESNGAKASGAVGAESRQATPPGTAPKVKAQVGGDPTAKPPPKARPRPVWQRPVFWLGVAAAVASLVFFVRRPGPDVVPKSPREVAEETRGLAIERCRAADWAACEAKLNVARELDPEGEGEAPVKWARGEIEAGGR